VGSGITSKEGNLNVRNTVTAGSFSGNGAGLVVPQSSVTGLPARLDSIARLADSLGRKTVSGVSIQDGTVDSIDIAPNAIRGSHIKDSTITRRDLAASLTASIDTNTAGIAFATDSNFNNWQQVTDAGEKRTVLTLSFQAPCNGYALITGDAIVQRNAAGMGTIWIFAGMKIDNVELTTLPTSLFTLMETQCMAFSLTRGTPITAGAHTIQLWFQNNTASSGGFVVITPSLSMAFSKRRL
jgi:hypothetical protein